MSQTQITTEMLMYLAETFEGLASEYRAIAHRANAAGVDSFESRGIKTVMDEVTKRVRSNINTVNSSLQDHLHKKSVRSFDELSQMDELSKAAKAGSVKKKAKTPRKTKRKEGEA